MTHKLSATDKYMVPARSVITHAKLHHDAAECQSRHYILETTNKSCDPACLALPQHTPSNGCIIQKPFGIQTHCKSPSLAATNAVAHAATARCPPWLADAPGIARHGARSRPPLRKHMTAPRPSSCAATAAGPCCWSRHPSTASSWYLIGTHVAAGREATNRRRRLAEVPPQR
jgi:hypothetical protein